MKKTTLCILLFVLVITSYGRTYFRDTYWLWDSKRKIAFKAIIRNDYPTFYRMIKKGVDVNAVNDRNNSLLSCASGNSRSLMVSLLLSNGADPNKYPAGTDSPLNRAAYRGRMDISKELLKYGAIPSLPDNGNYAIIKMLLKAGAKHDLMCGRRPVLHAVVLGRDTEIIKLLLSYGAKVDALQDGKTVLARVVSRYNNGQFNMITKAEILLEAGASVNLCKKNYSGRTFPLYLAAETRNTELVELLIAHGADVNKKIIVPFAMSSCSMSSRLLSAKKMEIVVPFTMRTRLLPGKNIKIKETVLSPLSAAIKSNYLPMVKLLLKHGAKATAKQLLAIKKLKPPGKPETLDLFKILLSGKWGRYESIKLAIAAGADINALNQYRQSLLEKLVDRGGIDLLRLLLKHGAKYKSEALRYAVVSGNVSIVKLLLKNGADPNFISRNYPSRPTAIFALGRNATTILPLLLKAGADVKQLNNKGENAPAVIFYDSLIKTKLNRSAVCKAGVNIAKSIIENDYHEQRNCYIKILLDYGVDRKKIRKLAEKYDRKNLLFLLDNVWGKK